MLPRTYRAALSLIAAAALVVPATATGAADQSDRARPKRWGEITRIDGGLRYRASQHDSRLVMRREGDRLVLVDHAERRWLSLPRGCHRVTVDVGIGASCRVPATATAADPLQLQIWPRLGDDRVDGSALGAEFQIEVLGDAGNDVIFTGAGKDYVNGAFGRDRVNGGAGRDFIRTGDANDVANGGAGNDHLVGLEGDDRLFGSEGADKLEGGVADDTLLGGAGSDILLCGDGNDSADDNDADDDAARHCEHRID
jgi:serralysin